MKKFLTSPLHSQIYLLAIAVYLLVGSFFIVPRLQRHVIAESVASSLHQQQAVIATQPPVAIVSGHPISISIPRLNINFPVVRGSYNALSRKWTLNSQHVFEAATSTTTPVISNSATTQPLNTVLYGHNFMNVIGNTVNLVPGDQMKITTDTGYTFTYYYVSSDVVTPTNTSVLSTKNTGQPVSLITCTGMFDQVRRVMHFALLGNPVATATTKEPTQ